MAAPGDNRLPSIKERAAFATSAAIIAVCIIVDALLDLRPGARAADHIVETVVPIAILAVASLLIPRLRAGCRAAVESFVGILALVGAGLTFADAAIAGFRAPHLIGFFLAAAGACLLWLAGAGLMRSRRPGRMRYLRRAGWAALALLVGYWVVLPIGLAGFATHRPQTPPPALAAGIEYEEVALQTADGIRLHGWYIPSRNGAAVLSYPRGSTTAHAALLAEKGYGVLLLDMRGYGLSEGDPNAFGWGCTRDIDAGVAYLQSRPDVDGGRIGGLGLSVGGEQMIEAAAANPALKAVLSDGAGERSVREGLLRGPKGYFPIPMTAVQTAAVAMFTTQTPPPALDQPAAAVAPRALFLIHAENGGGGEDLNPYYFAAASEPKSIWMVPGAGHTEGITEQPAEYARRLDDFFSQSLLAR